MRYGSTRQTAGLTVVILKDTRIVPVDHLVDTRQEVLKMHVGKDLYIFRVAEWWLGYAGT
jgi:hypothetical protein